MKSRLRRGGPGAERIIIIHTLVVANGKSVVLANIPDIDDPVTRAFLHQWKLQPRHRRRSDQRVGLRLGRPDGRGGCSGTDGLVVRARRDARST